MNTRLAQTIRQLVPLGLAALLFHAAGCANLFFKSTPPPAKTDATAKPAGAQVRVGGDGFALGEVDQSSLTPQTLCERVSEALTKKRPGEAARLTQRFPDVALALLREPHLAPAPPDVLLAIAQAHDLQVSRCAASAGWAALVADRTAHPDRYAPYDAQRRQFTAHLQNGALKEALQLRLEATPAGAPTALLQIDAQRLNGVALTLDGRPQEAAAAFAAAVGLARAEQPYQAAYLLLLQSDAQRRSGDLAGAQATWQTAAQEIVNLSGGAIPIADPILCERAAYLRPVVCAWPPGALVALDNINLAFGIGADLRQRAESAPPGGAHVEEAALWTAIGHWRLGRDEPQAALAALKRAESMTAVPQTAGRLQTAQARALMRLGQAQAANALLIRLAGSNDVIVSHPATAVLGALRLQQGNTQQGFNLLRRVVEGEPLVLWPERAQAEADLGLAYLMMGDEAAGFRFLHSAEQAFETAGQREQLVQCLENELAYLKQMKKKDLAGAVEHRLEALRS